VQWGPPITTLICGLIFLINLIISIELSSKEVIIVIPTISAVFNASESFFSSKVSAAKSSIVMLSPSFSRIFAI